MSDIPELVQGLQAEAAVEAEIGRRATTAVRPTVIRTPLAMRGDRALLREGTAVTLVGRRGSRYLADLADALRAGDAERARRAGEVALERADASLGLLTRRLDLRSASAIVDVTYGRSSLARHVVMGEAADIAISYAVWSGGEVADEQFSALSFPRTGSLDTDMEVLVILVEPELTDIERGVIRAVPAHLGDMHISGPSVGWTTVLTIGVGQQVMRDRGDVDVIENHLGFPVRHITRLVGGPLGQRQEQETTVQQQQQQQEDTRQQQQQQQVQQADTKHQQQQQQQQQQEANTRQQQQQQQHVQDQQQARQQEKHQQQQQQQDRDTQQRQHEQQQDNVNRADGQRDIYQHQHDQERQRDTRADQRHQDQRQHQDANTVQRNEWSKALGELMRQGLSLRELDRERYRSLLQAIDFDAMDATQSLKELLRLREELLKEGLG